jgi:AhpC/TSA family
MYDTSPLAKGPYGAGSVVFYAYPSQKPGKPAGPMQPDGTKRFGQEQQNPPAFYYTDTDGTVPIYGHQAGDRYFYNDNPGGGHGWSAGNVIFNAYSTAKPGTVPIYIHESNSPPDRYFLDRQVPNNYGWSNGTVAFYALPAGYTIGAKAADISGPDQQNHVVKLSGLLDGKSWVWIEICAEWCMPCQMMAKQTKAFLDFVNQQGLQLKLFSVLADDRQGSPSNQQAAERWAFRIGSGYTGSVVHCAGQPTSDVSQLVDRYALANGSPTPGYPTSVLVDPSGVIVHHHLGYDLDGLRDKLAYYSHQSLTTWPPTTSVAPTTTAQSTP